MKFPLSRARFKRQNVGFIKHRRKRKERKKKLENKSDIALPIISSTDSFFFLLNFVFLVEWETLNSLLSLWIYSRRLDRQTDKTILCQIGRHIIPISQNVHSILPTVCIYSFLNVPATQFLYQKWKFIIEAKWEEENLKRKIPFEAAMFISSNVQSIVCTEC